MQKTKEALTMVNLSAVAKAIIKITKSKGTVRFLPSEIREALQDQSNSDHSGQLSAKIQPYLRELRAMHIIDLESDRQQKRNRPYIVLDVARLSDLASPADDTLNKITSDSPHANLLLAEMQLIRQSIEGVKESLASLIGEGGRSGLTTMRDIVYSKELFARHFLLPHTKDRLKDIPIEVYQKVVANLFDLVGFQAAASPRYWTPNGSEQPLLVFGKIGAKGRMGSPRFGLTTDAPLDAGDQSTKIFLWLSESIAAEFSGARETSAFRIDDWHPWRAHEGKEKGKGELVYKRPFGFLTFNTEHDCQVELDINDEVAQWMARCCAKKTDNAEADFSAVTDLCGHEVGVVTPAMIDLRRHWERNNSL